MFISTIIGYFIFKDLYKNYFCSKAIGIFIALAFTVISFYTYSGIIGNNFAIIDIIIFIIAIILGEYISYKRIVENKYCNKRILGLLVGIFLISLIIFTFYPPKIDLFKDPITQTYGIFETK